MRKLLQEKGKKKGGGEGKKINFFRLIFFFSCFLFHEYLELPDGYSCEQSRSKGL